MSGSNLFDWIVPEHLAACVNPRLAGRVLDELRAHRIELLINLHEQPTSDALRTTGIREVHLPVRDFTPPSQAQLDDGVETITRALASAQRVAVHCGAGLGRTGTLLAAFFVSEGYAPADAIEHVRAIRPGSVETAAQEMGVAEYATRHRQ
ncbi:MAG: dual specificity protein phosphatase family protein [Chloroflexota bacterium]|nr:dual specificity protein phosphatase family protein [Chloroflexota bacterium]